MCTRAQAISTGLSVDREIAHVRLGTWPIMGGFMLCNNFSFVVLFQFSKIAKSALCRSMLRPNLYMSFGLLFSRPSY